MHVSWGVLLFAVGKSGTDVRGTTLGLLQPFGLCCTVHPRRLTRLAVKGYQHLEEPQNSDVYWYCFVAK